MLNKICISARIWWLRHRIRSLNDRLAVTKSVEDAREARRCAARLSEAYKALKKVLHGAA